MKSSPEQNVLKKFRDPEAREWLALWNDLFFGKKLA